MASNDRRHQLGERAELMAAHYLLSHGYRIRHSRFRTRHGEVDIVASEGKTLVFIEVKARASPRFEHAVEAVTPLKLYRLSWVAEAYFQRYTWDGPWRIDVIGFTFSPNGTLLHLEHLKDVTNSS